MSSDLKPRSYDGVIIYQTGEGTVASGRSFVAEEFKNNEIQVAGDNDMGERNLAYQIKKNDRGHYVRYELVALPEKLQQLDKSFRLKSEILKFVFFRTDN